MKLSVILIFFTAILGTGSVMAQPAKSKIVFDDQEHDFGVIKEEAGPKSYIFHFTNKGNAPLILNNVRASCGCTTPEWTQKPIPPGEKGAVKVSYNPQNRPGPFHKTISVYTNGEEPQSVLRISGIVTPHPKTTAELYPREIGPVRAKSNYIVFPEIKKNQVLTDTLEIINDSGAPVTLNFRTPPVHLKARVVPATLNPDEKGNIIVTYDAGKIDSYGFVMNRIYLNVNGKSDYRSSIGVSATIEEDFSSLTPQELANAPVISFNEESHDFGNVKEGNKVSYVFSIKNGGKRDLILHDVKTSCGCTVVTPEKKVIPAGQRIPLKVEFNSRGKRGRQNKAITIISNDPHNPTSILRITSNVVSE